MIPFSDSFFADSATLWPAVEDAGPTGTPFHGWPNAGPTAACRAEYGAGSFKNASRAAWADAAESRSDWTLYFQADPGCVAEDKFILNGTRAMIALGAARRDASGSGVLFAVDCEERS